MQGLKRLLPFHYAWLIAAVTFVMMLLSAGIRSVPGVLILPLEQEFGWSRATLSLAVSINLFIYGLCGPFAAATMERLGMRRMIISSLTIVAIATGLTTLMTEAWQLQLLWGVVVGLGTGATAGWLSASISNRWFVANRGLVIGLLTASNATGQLIFLPVLASLAVGIGWRTVVALVAVVALVLIVPVFLFIRNFPEDIGLRAYGAKDSDKPAPRITSGNPFTGALSTLRECLKSRDFLLLAGSFFICGASTSGLIGTHLIPAASEHDIPEVTAAGLLAFIGIFDLMGTTASGWLSDRFDNRKLLLWYYTLRGLSLLVLPFAFGAGYFGLAVFIVFYGLDWVATVPPTVRLAADLFGRHRVGTVYAWIFAAHQMGASLAAFGAGALRTWLGDYQAAFMTAGVLCLLAAGLVIRIGRPAPTAAVLLPNNEPLGAPAG